MAAFFRPVVKVFIMWLLYVQLLSRKNRYGLAWAIMINPPELPINDEARTKNILQEEVCDGIVAQKSKQETSDAS